MGSPRGSGAAPRLLGVRGVAAATRGGAGGARCLRRTSSCCSRTSSSEPSSSVKRSSISSTTSAPRAAPRRAAPPSPGALAPRARRPRVARRAQLQCGGHAVRRARRLRDDLVRRDRPAAQRLLCAEGVPAPIRHGLDLRQPDVHRLDDVRERVGLGQGAARQGRLDGQGGRGDARREVRRIATWPLAPRHVAARTSPAARRSPARALDAAGRVRTGRSSSPALASASSSRCSP